MQLAILQKVRFQTTWPSYDTISLIQFSLITSKIFPWQYNWNLINSCHTVHQQESASVVLCTGKEQSTSVQGE